jgi:flagellar protein FliO/FliZ
MAVVPAAEALSMDITDFLRAVFALALTLGLVGLAAVALRKYGPDAMARLASQKKDRRLKVVESLVLDPARRILIVECDGRERLILLGEGRLLSELSAKDAR